MKKALLISYRFPPQGGGGVQRTLKYVKFLREHGWEPVVQTARGPVWPVWDESLLAEVPAGVAIHHTPVLEPERLEKLVLAALRPLLGKSRRAGVPATVAPPLVAAGASGATTAARPSKPRPRRPHPLRQLRDWIYGRLFVPDAQRVWGPLAVAHGIMIARRGGVDLIYTSSPPNSVHSIGGRIARRLGLPWVADFRDPWTDGPRRRRSYAGNPRREKREAEQERWVMRHADRIVVSAPALRERFLEKYDFLRPEHVCVLTNGFDRDDLAASEREQSGLEPGLFHLTGTGNIEAMVDMRPCFEAIAEACVEHPDLGHALRVNLVGAKKGQWDAEIARLGLGERVRYTGWVSHARAIRFLRDSQLLLMCQLVEEGGGGEKLSGKFFEYLATGKPVLALTVPGLTSKILGETGVGHVHAPVDKDGIKATLVRAFAARAASPRADPAVVARYDRRVLASQLAALFDEVVAEHGQAGSRPAAPAAGPAHARGNESGDGSPATWSEPHAASGGMQP